MDERTELAKTDELMVMGEELEYAAIHIPLCTFKVETHTYSYPTYIDDWWRQHFSKDPTTVTFSLGNIRKYFYKEEGDPLRRMQKCNTDAYEAILLIRPKGTSQE